MSYSTLQRSPFKARRSRLSKRGPRTKAWDNERRRLKKEFAEVLGITSCELGFANCTGTENLGFMHAFKRRNIKREELAGAPVVLGCNNCHWEWERLGEAAMSVKILAHAATRADRYVEATF
jgi:hypothetical protein